jgi:hypothetical protein
VRIIIQCAKWSRLAQRESSFAHSDTDGLFRESNKCQVAIADLLRDVMVTVECICVRNGDVLMTSSSINDLLLHIIDVIRQMRLQAAEYDPLEMLERHLLFNHLVIITRC